MPQTSSVCGSESRSSPALSVPCHAVYDNQLDPCPIGIGGAWTVICRSADRMLGTRIEGLLAVRVLADAAANEHSGLRSPGPCLPLVQRWRHLGCRCARLWFCSAWNRLWCGLAGSHLWVVWRQHQRECEPRGTRPGQPMQRFWILLAVPELSFICSTRHMMNNGL
jgi:hypothetical protein